MKKVILAAVLMLNAVLCFAGFTVEGVGAGSLVIENEVEGLMVHIGGMYSGKSIKMNGKKRFECNNGQKMVIDILQDDGSLAPRVKLAELRDFDKKQNGTHIQKGTKKGTNKATELVYEFYSEKCGQEVSTCFTVDGLQKIHIKITGFLIDGEPLKKPSSKEKEEERLEAAKKLFQNFFAEEL